jgi:hypothetical protein
VINKCIFLRNALKNDVKDENEFSDYNNKPECFMLQGDSVTINIVDRVKNSDQEVNNETYHIL